MAVSWVTRFRHKVATIPFVASIVVPLSVAGYVLYDRYPGAGNESVVDFEVPAEFAELPELSLPVDVSAESVCIDADVTEQNIGRCSGADTALGGAP